MQGMVFDIQRLCVHDGPGIRTTVFLKGCPMHCFWCHNPESIRPERQLLFFADSCIHCFQCIKVCEAKAHYQEQGRHMFQRNLCTGCGRCANVCAANALVLSGTAMTVEQVMEEILKDTSFYQNSNGGITISGGEPLLQIDFLADLLHTCKKYGIHTAIETAGHVGWDRFARILDDTDLFLYDVKVMDPIVHKRVTGADNHSCLSNLGRLLETKKAVRVRVPVIPGVNDSKTAIRDIKCWVSERRAAVPIELLPFHTMGQTKYGGLGLSYPAASLQLPDEETMKRLRTIVDSGVSK